MIAVASAEYCERCKCKTLHVPMPSGERVCEWHLPTPEGDAPPAPPPEQREPAEAHA